MPQIILILGIIGLNLTVMLVSLKMNWLDILPMSIHLVGFTLLAAILSKKLIRSRGHLPFLNFRAIVITIGLLFGSMTTNVLFQLGQKQVIGHVQTADSSKAAYEGQHGRAVELFGRKLTDEQANALSQAKRVAHEFVGVFEEEVIFRWVILGSLLMLVSPPWALFISSILFAASHLVFPIALGDLEFGLMRLLPTFAIGVFCGVAYLWYGLPASVFVHFAGNLIRVFAFDEYDFIVDWILWGSAFVTLFILPPTLWFTRKREALA